MGLALSFAPRYVVGRSSIVTRTCSARSSSREAGEGRSSAQSSSSSAGEEERGGEAESGAERAVKNVGVGSRDSGTSNETGEDAPALARASAASLPRTPMWARTFWTVTPPGRVAAASTMA